MEIGKQTSWMKNKPIFSNNATIHCMIIGKRQTNELDKKQTNYEKAATMLCMINGNRQTN